MTGTPCVSSTSSVRPISSTDLAPAHTTATSVRPSSSRSAEMSMVSSAPRCAPPMPPVANTRIPARAADQHRAGDRRGAVGSGGKQYRDVTARCLGDSLRGPEVLDLGPREAHLEPPAEDRDGRRGHTLFAGDAFTLPRALDVGRVGESVADDRRLQRDHRSAVVQGTADLGRAGQVVVHERISFIAERIADRSIDSLTVLVLARAAAAIADPNCGALQQCHAPGACRRRRLP